MRAVSTTKAFILFVVQGAWNAQYFFGGEGGRGGVGFFLGGGGQEAHFFPHQIELRREQLPVTVSRLKFPAVMEARSGGGKGASAHERRQGQRAPSRRHGASGRQLPKLQAARPTRLHEGRDVDVALTPLVAKVGARLVGDEGPDVHVVVDGGGRHVEGVHQEARLPRASCLLGGG